MADPSFSIQAIEFLENLVECMESSEPLEDVDIDLIDGVLTVEFDDSSQMVINRQEAARQIWLVSPLGPAHFSYEPQQQAWLDDRTGDELMAVLEQVFSEKLGQTVVLGG